MTDGATFWWTTVPPGGGPPNHVQVARRKWKPSKSWKVTSCPTVKTGRFRRDRAPASAFVSAYCSPSTPAGIEALLDSLAAMEKPEGGFTDVIAALNRLGAGYGVTYLAD